jgi:hypothetical protein
LTETEKEEKIKSRVWKEENYRKIIQQEKEKT